VAERSPNELGTLWRWLRLPKRIGTWSLIGPLRTQVATEAAWV
jgi:hypothetical protein